MILQDAIPYDPFKTARLPGVTPLAEGDWLLRDEAFAGQLAERDRLVAERPGDVLALDDTAREAALELLDAVCARAYPGQGGGNVMRPDGVGVAIDRDAPMASLARLVQEDFCILHKQGDEHVLTGAALCFPAGWTLAEKFLHPLSVIHDPVEPYDEGIAKRVQRLFDGVRAGRPLWRCNALWYRSPDLYQPRTEADPKRDPGALPGFLRSERQVLMRLPQTRAMVFVIHTYVVARDAVRSGAQTQPCPASLCSGG